MAVTAPKYAGAKQAGTVDLPAERFGAEWRQHLVWHVVRNELLARRQGTHATKNRAKVRGGGAKPWRQKGTGRARQGSRVSPQWTGGGVVFGPSPRSYGGKVNRKERVAAMNSALSAHVARGSMHVLADDAIAEPSTKQAAAVRQACAADAHKTLIVVGAEQAPIWRSFRNLNDVQVVDVADLDVADVMWGRSMIVTEHALQTLQGTGGN